jgi:hypothetical protein
MELSVVYDDEGTILAAAISGEDGDEPLPQPGESSGVYEVPDELSGGELHEVVQRLKIDVEARKLTQRS